MVIKTKDNEREMIIDNLSDLFGALSDGERAHLLACMTRRLYRKGELIYREGDMPRQLLCLVSGKAKIFKEGVGRSQIVRVVKPIGYFGYRWNDTFLNYAGELHGAPAGFEFARSYLFSGYSYTLRVQGEDEDGRELLYLMMPDNMGRQM